MTTVLVTGVGGPAGRALVPQLLAQGLQVHGVDMNPDHPAGIGFELVPPALDPEYPQILLAIADRVGAELIIPTVSEELPVVARLADPRIVVGNVSAVGLAADKWLSCQALADAGVAVPRSALVGQFDESVADWIGLPAVTKPRVGRGGRGVVVHDEWFDPAVLAEDHLVSEFAPGEEFCPNLFIGAESRDDTVVVLRKTGLKQGRHGNATGVERIHSAEIAQLALAAARALGLSGPVDIDIRRRADGTPVVLEINARFGANSTYAPEILAAVLRTRLAVSA